MYSSAQDASRPELMRAFATLSYQPLESAYGCRRDDPMRAGETRYHRDVYSPEMSLPV